MGRELQISLHPESSLVSALFSSLHPHQFLNFCFLVVLNNYRPPNSKNNKHIDHFMTIQMACFPSPGIILTIHVLISLNDLTTISYQEVNKQDSHYDDIDYPNEVGSCRKRDFRPLCAAVTSKSKYGIIWSPCCHYHYFDE